MKDNKLLIRPRRLLLLIFICVTACSVSDKHVNYVDVPANVVTHGTKVIALKVSGEQGKIQKDVRIPLSRLQSLSANLNDIYLVDYDAQETGAAGYYRDEDSVVADLVGGHIYLLGTMPQGPVRKNYSTLAAIQDIAGTDFPKIYPDLCPLIFCSPEGLGADKILKAVPGLKPYGKTILSRKLSTNGVVAKTGGLCKTCGPGDEPSQRDPVFPPLVDCRPFCGIALDNTRISFISNLRTNDSGKYEIFTMRPDGSGKQKLTRNNYYDGAAPWSPDGWLTHNANADIRIMKYDDSQSPRLLTTGSSLDGVPVWSPDGRRITYVSKKSVNAYETVNVIEQDDLGDWTRKYMIANGWYTEGSNRNVWSPDSRQVTYAMTKCLASAGCTEKMDIIVAYADGSGIDNLTTTPDIDERHPSWSVLDRIAYSVVPQSEIYVINATDGGNQQNLTEDLVEPAERPIWSPDGTRIAFLVLIDGRKKLYVMDDDGGHRENLTPGKCGGTCDVTDFYWSPDGSNIVFSSKVESSATRDIESILTVHVATKSINDLTGARYYDSKYPRWSYKLPE